MSIRITVDVENLSGSISETSFMDAVEPLLVLLANHGATATFFVVGSLAPVWKKKVSLLSQSGHEIALHGHTHEYLEKLGPSKFILDLKDGKQALQSVVGKEVVGYRAPYFSLTSKVKWAPEILVDHGFRFSSSVLPAWNPQAGFPTAPRVPFRWESGLVEFPVPTFGLGRLRFPLLGGAYLRLAPQPVFQLVHKIGSRRPGEWSYCHPYDFDTHAPFERVRDSSWVFSKLLFMRRHLMLERIDKLLEDGISRSFEDLVDDVRYVEALPWFGRRARSAS